jgi:hypothetical protein
MNLREQLSEIVGQWQGVSRLWVSPDEPVRESDATASIAPVGHERFVTVQYTWADGGRTQDGLLIVRNSPDPSSDDMVWIDSWHTGSRFMVFRGQHGEGGRVSALSSYPAPPGPDWGWRIVLEAETPDRLRIVMFNISPDGDEALAAEMQWTRTA